MRTTAIKYKDRHQNEVIFVTSDSYFSTLFLQKKRLSESSKFRSNHNVSPYNHPFTFTGKERDAETGYSYFGARYYDSDLSGLFLSVDPMAYKYPSLSPYVYCAWNPVKLVDPDGREIIISKEDWRILEFSLIQTLGEKHPFFYDESTGRVRYDNAKMESFQFCDAKILLFLHLLRE